MHAGDAIWNLAALVELAKRRIGPLGDSPAFQVCQESLNELSNYSKVQLPDAAALDSIVRQMEATLQPAQPRTTPTVPVPNSGIGKEVADMCTEILDMFEDMPDAAADFIDGVEPKVKSVRDFVAQRGYASEKQRDMIANILAGCKKWRGGADGGGRFGGYDG